MGSVRLIALSIAVTLFSVGKSARAQDEEAPPPPAPEPVATCAPGDAACAPEPAPRDELAYRPHRYHVFAPSEVVLTTGAGVANYFGSNVRPTDTGAAWNARVMVGVHSAIALEAAYIGTSNVFNTPLAEDLHLTSHGVDTDLRLQLPFRVQPYIFGGVGYNHVTLNVKGSSTPAVTRDQRDDQVTIPAGGGLTAYIGRHATVDVRGTYRYIPDNGLSVLGDRHLHQWMAQASAGYAF